MTPQAKRFAWIGGLAAAGAALVGGVAYAVAKSIGTTTPGGTPAPTTGATPPATPKATGIPTPSLSLVPAPTYVIGTSPPPPPPTPVTPPPTNPGGVPQFINLVPGQDTTVQALAGLLTIRVPANLYYVSASINSGAGTFPTYGPTDFHTGISPAGAVIYIPLTGNPGSVVVGGLFPESEGGSSWSTTITVQ